MIYFKILLRSYLITVLTETAAGWIAGLRMRDELLVILLVNTLTNPLLVATKLIMNLFLPYRTLMTVLLILEVLIWAVEGFLYKKEKMPFRHPYLFSIGANLLSFAAGYLLLSIQGTGLADLFIWSFL